MNTLFCSFVYPATYSAVSTSNNHIYDVLATYSTLDDHDVTDYFLSNKNLKNLMGNTDMMQHAFSI